MRIPRQILYSVILRTALLNQGVIISTIWKLWRRKRQFSYLAPYIYNTLPRSRIRYCFCIQNSWTRRSTNNCQHIYTFIGRASESRNAKNKKVVCLIKNNTRKKGHFTLCGRGFRPLWPEASVVYDADSFTCLIFDPSKMPESCLESHRISPFQPCAQIALNGRFSFRACVFSHLCVPRHTGGLWATHGRFVGVVYSLFSVVVIPGFCSMGFLLDKEILVVHPILLSSVCFWVLIQSLVFHLSISQVIKARAKQKDSHIHWNGNTNRRTKLFA